MRCCPPVHFPVMTASLGRYRRSRTLSKSLVAKSELALLLVKIERDRGLAPTLRRHLCLAAYCPTTSWRGRPETWAFEVQASIHRWECRANFLCYLVSARHTAPRTTCQEGLIRKARGPSRANPLFRRQWPSPYSCHRCRDRPRRPAAIRDCFGFDPALASGPITTVFQDATTLVIYLSGNSCGAVHLNGTGGPELSTPCLLLGLGQNRRVNAGHLHSCRVDRNQLGQLS